jgi:hypothetical protein
MAAVLKITKAKEPASAPRTGGTRAGAGRPAIPVPDTIMKALDQAKGLGSDESLKVGLDTERLAKQFVNQLTKGAKQLELRLFKTIVVADDGSAVVRFRTEPKGNVAELFT